MIRGKLTRVYVVFLCVIWVAVNGEVGAVLTYDSCVALVKAGPLLTLPEAESFRDPSIIYDYQAGVYRVFFTHVVSDPMVEHGRIWRVAMMETEDFQSFGPIQALTPGGYASPGTVVKLGHEWVIPIQSYQPTPGNVWAGQDCRLYFLRTIDSSLTTWSAPIPHPLNSYMAEWNNLPRKIDADMVQAPNGLWHMLCKMQTRAGPSAFAYWSSREPLAVWQDNTITGPFMGDLFVGCENPQIVWQAEGLVLLYSPGNPPRGISLVYRRGYNFSATVGWHKVVLRVEPVWWAPSGVTAPFYFEAMSSEQDQVIKLLFYHGELIDSEIEGKEQGALGMAVHCPVTEKWIFGQPSLATNSVWKELP